MKVGKFGMIWIRKEKADKIFNFEATNTYGYIDSEYWWNQGGLPGAIAPQISENSFVFLKNYITSYIWPLQSFQKFPYIFESYMYFLDVALPKNFFYVVPWEELLGPPLILREFGWHQPLKELKVRFHGLRNPIWSSRVHLSYMPRIEPWIFKWKPHSSAKSAA